MDDVDKAAIADLNRRLGVFEDYFRIGKNADGERKCMTMGRFGVMTDFWMNVPRGEGAAFSVGTVGDRYGCYVEMEETVCQTGPTSAYLGWVKCPNERQLNVGMELHVAGSHGKPGIAMLADAEAIQIGGAERFYIGKTPADAKQLWP